MKTGEGQMVDNGEHRSLNQNGVAVENNKQHDDDVIKRFKAAETVPERSRKWKLIVDDDENVVKRFRVAETMPI